VSVAFERRSTRPRTTPSLTGWWHSRLGAQLLREVGLVVGLLALYRLGRYLSRDQVASAFDHAAAVLSFEKQLGLAVESHVQSIVLEHRWLTNALNQYYVRVHFPVTIAFLVITYVRTPELYRHVRNLFVIVTGLGLVMHAVYPLAPPRMLPGFIDTIARYGPSIYERSDVASVANQYAAMPSMHFGWAVLVAYGVVRAGNGRWRWIVVAHPVATLVAITATANHYWLDAAVAGVLIVVAIRLTDDAGPALVPLPAGAQAADLGSGAHVGSGETSQLESSPRGLRFEPGLSALRARGTRPRA